MLSYDLFDINWDYYLNECLKSRALQGFVGNLDKYYGTNYIYAIDAIVCPDYIFPFASTK